MVPLVASPDVALLQIVSIGDNGGFKSRCPTALPFPCTVLAAAAAASSVVVGGQPWDDVGRFVAVAIVGVAQDCGGIVLQTVVAATSKTKHFGGGTGVDRTMATPDGLWEKRGGRRR